MQTNNTLDVKGVTNHGSIVTVHGYEAERAMPSAGSPLMHEVIPIRQGVPREPGMEFVPPGTYVLPTRRVQILRGAGGRTKFTGIPGGATEEKPIPKWRRNSFPLPTAYQTTKD